MKRTLTRIALTAVLTSAAAGSAFAANGFNPFYYDGYQPFHSRAIAGAAPNSDATFNYGVRCHYEYRVQHTPYGRQRVRINVCN